MFGGDWFHTKDAAQEDEDGYYWYEGRADDVIISAGYRIGPFEVESACLEHAAVAEAAAVASPDDPSFTGPVGVDGFGTYVSAVAQVGSLMVAGGNFTTVNGAARPFLAGWTAPAGAIDTALATGTSAPDGEVDAIEPTGGRTGFYAAGHFKHVGTTATNVALFSIVNGARVTTFKPSSRTARSTRMQLVGSHLLIGGYFAHVNGAALRPGVGELHDRRGRQLPAGPPLRTPQLRARTAAGGARGRPGRGAISMAVSPDGSRMMVIGNFTTAQRLRRTTGYARDQIVNIKLTRHRPTVDPSWATLVVPSDLRPSTFDSYVHAGCLGAGRQLLRRRRRRWLHHEQPPAL